MFSCIYYIYCSFSRKLSYNYILKILFTICITIAIIYITFIAQALSLKISISFQVAYAMTTTQGYPGCRWPLPAALAAPPRCWAGRQRRKKRRRRKTGWIYPKKLPLQLRWGAAAGPY